MNVQLNIINQYQGKLPFDLEAAVAAIQIQVTRDFIPQWFKFLLFDGALVTAVTITIQTELQPGAYPIYLKNVSDLQGAEGYHDDEENKIEGYVFIDTTVQGGDDPVVTLSHEVLELLADPLTNLTANVGALTFSRENCDPTQETTYQINGVSVSNFCYPAWFDLETGDKFDYLGKCTRPGQLLKGGYISVLRHGHWHQIFATANAAGKYNPAAHHRVHKRKPSKKGHAA